MLGFLIFWGVVIIIIIKVKKKKAKKAEEEEKTKREIFSNYVEKIVEAANAEENRVYFLDM